LPEAPFQHLEKRHFDVGNEGFKVWRAFDAEHTGAKVEV
jgi:N-carbamoyl-D-amino-acid hydrolase